MKFIHILVEILIDAVSNIRLFIESNLKHFASLISICLPYIMYVLGQYVSLDRGEICVGGEALIPIVIGLLVFFMNSYANKIGKGITVPVPEKRFTEVDDDGEVSIEHARIQELLLYTADLEDWLERKGLM